MLCSQVKIWLVRDALHTGMLTAFGFCFHNIKMKKIRSRGNGINHLKNDDKVRNASFLKDGENSIQEAILVSDETKFGTLFGTMALDRS